MTITANTTTKLVATTLIALSPSAFATPDKRRASMISKMAASILGTLAILGSGVTSADELEGVTVTSKPSARFGTEARAVGVCGDAVVGKLLPNYTKEVRVVVPYRSMHEWFIEGSSYVPHIPVALTARYNRTGELLASASCTVSSKGEIETMSIKLKNGELLAGLKPSDIRLAMVGR
jgi:hypothetical protein